jgi:hypothetical protein
MLSLMILQKTLEKPKTQEAKYPQSPIPKKTVQPEIANLSHKLATTSGLHPKMVNPQAVVANKSLKGQNAAKANIQAETAKEKKQGTDSGKKLILL